MGDYLKPGDMGIDIDDMSNSMALKMEQELDRLMVQVDKLPALPFDRERRRLFVAIARGVVTHLRDNANAFTIHVDTAPDDVAPIIQTIGV